ncbi:MAG: hypothetical protein ABH831_02325, partial [Candidatus Nealsonbacteria bacterium]
MQNIDNPSNNPLKPKISQNDQKSKTKNKLKLNRKTILIAIPVILGILSLLITAIARKDTPPNNEIIPIPTIPQQQNSEILLPGDEWQQELDLINQQTNQN